MTTNSLWADFVSQNRKSQGMTRRKLAETAGIDPSYITLIEKNGVIPRKDKVIRLAEALNQDTDAALLLAGYAPKNLQPEAVKSDNPAFGSNDSAQRQEELQWLHPELRVCMNQLAKLPDTAQRTAADLLKVFVHSMDQRDMINSKGA